MRTYGKTLFEKDGFTMVEVWEIHAAGQKVLIGYAICDPDGGEIDFFGSYDDALAEFQRITDDNEPPSGYGP
ncbi:hypothetical protein ASD15_31410 [Massilia sp. Root351]|jgi:hypothetical protein|nr:hypothetical protein ASD15_31410 [Massilia sp. Root351]